MFLMFQLLRPDVLPVGDLGIRRAFMVHSGFEQLPKPAEMEPIAEPWRPHRTLASLFLWRSIAGDAGLSRDNVPLGAPARIAGNKLRRSRSPG